MYFLTLNGKHDISGKFESYNYIPSNHLHGSNWEWYLYCFVHKQKLKFMWNINMKYIRNNSNATDKFLRLNCFIRIPN